MDNLRPQEGGCFIDCTLGGAGYTLALRERIGESGRILSIDLDPLAIANAENKIRENQYQNIKLANDNFKNLSKIIRENHAGESAGFDGIVLDLGLSSAQLEDRNRGFSFVADSALKMEMGATGGESGIISTEIIVNKWKEEELTKIIKEYGEEGFAGRIARRIVEARKDKAITTTGQLVDIIRSAIPKKFQNQKIHPATRTFQALRIATNGELRNIEEVLPQALDALKPGGRIAVVSFHSLEDRIVKNFFRSEAKDCICPPLAPVCCCEHEPRLKIITKKIIEPSEEEVRVNPRSRSAKLRVAEKI